MNVKILLLLILIGSGSLFAQTAKKEWTLQECVDYALSNNLLVKRSLLSVETNHVNYTQSKMGLLPSANARGSYGFNWGRGLDPVTNQFVASQRNTVSSIGANGSLTLFNGLRVQSSIKQSSRDYEASEQDLAKAKNDVTVNIVTQFISVVLNKELVENARLQLETSKRQLDQTQRRVEAGGLPKVDALNIEAQVASNELSLINQENALTLSILQLKQAMQIPASNDFDVVVPQVDPEDLVIEQTRDEIFAIAKETMPEIKSSQLKIESSFFAVKASKANLFPTLSLTGSLQTNYSESSETIFTPDGGYTVGASPIAQTQGGENVFSIRPTGTFADTYRFGDQFTDNLYKSIGLSLNIPIFNNYQSRASYQRTVILNEQAKITAKETENTLRQTIETVYNDAFAASKTYSSSLKQVEAREEAFRATQQRYDLGATSFMEYQTSENNLFQAKSDLARAKYNFIFRKKVLDFYIGKPIQL